MLLLNELKDLTGKKAIIVGRSNIVGKPMASLLIGENCTVTIAHSRTKNLEEEVKKSDIVVAAVGVPEMVKGSWIKPGAAVIDVGINRIEKDGKKIAIFNKDGLHALDAMCAHQNNSIAHGEIDGDIVECPYHFWHYNIKTGDLQDYLKGVKQQTYKVEVREDGIYIDI